MEERFVVNKVDETKGLRIITGGGVSSGINAGLWFGEEITGRESRERIVAMVQHSYKEGRDCAMRSTVLHLP